MMDFLYSLETIWHLIRKKSVYCIESIFFSYPSLPPPKERWIIPDTLCSASFNSIESSPCVWATSLAKSLEYFYKPKEVRDKIWKATEKKKSWHTSKCVARCDIGLPSELKKFCTTLDISFWTVKSRGNGRKRWCCVSCDVCPERVTLPSCELQRQMVSTMLKLYL